MRSLILVIAFAALAGCEVTHDMAISKGKDMVASSLKDPKSATFSGVFMRVDKTTSDTKSGYLCGLVNSKNSFGGYTGSIRFAASFSYSKGGNFSLGSLELEEGQNTNKTVDGSTLFERVYWQNRCESGRNVANAPVQSGSSKPVTIGMQSMPSEKEMVTRSSPDVRADRSKPIMKGQVVTVQEQKDGWVRVSKDPDTPQWVLPESLNWK